MLLSFVFLCQLKRNIFYSPNRIVGIVNSKFFWRFCLHFSTVCSVLDELFWVQTQNTSLHCWILHLLKIDITLFYASRLHSLHKMIHYTTYIIHYILTHEFWAVWLLLFHYILALNAFSHPLFIAINFIVLIKDPLHEIHTW